MGAREGLAKKVAVSEHLKRKEDSEGTLGERTGTGRSGKVLGRDCAYWIPGRARQPVRLQQQMRSQRSQQVSPGTVRYWPRKRLGLLPRETRSHWSQAEEQYGLC